MINHVRNWPTPRTAAETRTFLGFSIYYRIFVKYYANIARPLHDIDLQILVGSLSIKRSGLTLQSTHLSGKMSNKHNLKDRLTSSPILIYPDYEKPFILHTSASIEGLVSVLDQDVDGRERVIAYASRGLTKPEINYPVHNF